MVLATNIMFLILGQQPNLIWRIQDNTTIMGKNGTPLGERGVFNHQTSTKGLKETRSNLVIFPKSMFEIGYSSCMFIIVSLVSDCSFSKEQEKAMLTGKGTNSSPEQRNGFSWLLSIILQSSWATRLTSCPSFNFLVAKYGNFTEMLLQI